jgi:hypothetical protein
MNDCSTMADEVRNHRNYVKPWSSKTTMCCTRAAMESIAYRSQKRQAIQVNLNRIQDEKFKQVLEYGDIGVIYVPPKTRNSCDHPYLPVMVTGCKQSSETQHLVYNLCCQYSHLQGFFTRESIRHEEHLTAKLMQIDPLGSSFERRKFTVEEASAKHNILGGKSFCRCRRDCTLVAKCSCIALGHLCKEKCHGGAKDGNKVQCSNCVNHRVLQGINSNRRKINSSRKRHRAS